MFTRFLNSIFSGLTRLDFRRPRPADVVVLDAITSDYLQDMLLGGISCSFLDTRFGQYPCTLHVAPVVLLRTLWNALSQVLFENNGELSLEARLRACYFAACFQAIRPRVVLDFIHDPGLVFMAKLYLHGEFFVISNGFWNDALDFEMDDGSFRQIYQYRLARMNLKAVQRVHIFCYGQKDVDIFAQSGVTEEKTGIRFHVSGPLFADYHAADEGLNAAQESYDICLCSQAGVSHLARDTEFTRALMECNDLLTEFLGRYVRSRGVSCVIAPRTCEPGVDPGPEHDYFSRRLAGLPGVTVAPRTDHYSTYRLMARSKIVISVNSAAGFDAMKWGKKVMFCPFHLSRVYKISSARYESDAHMWKWTVTQPDYADFERKLDELRALPHDLYIDSMRDVAQDIVNRGSATPAHRYIREMIERAMADHRA